MVQTSVIGALHHLANGVCRDIGQQLGPRGSAKLIVNHAEVVTLAGQTQHGLGKIAAACGVDPAGAKNQMLGAGCSNHLLTFAFGLTVNTQGRRCIGLYPRSMALAVKHIVGAVVHQQRPQFGRLGGQHTRRQRIQEARRLRLALGFVHRGVSSRIDDNVGSHRVHRGSQTF